MHTSVYIFIGHCHLEVDQLSTTFFLAHEHRDLNWGSQAIVSYVKSIHQSNEISLEWFCTCFQGLHTGLVAYYVQHFLLGFSFLIHIAICTDFRDMQVIS